ncbi:transmembrane amino acid transporter protein-domain-containing protein [Exophiala viscosa]|uniref:Transmembrane amino acid transporter protein-domain-containing protein n=1 Tax=Exophiala viscosa TaxID=2486360 RepID=A0AAN6DTE3_9EURO|nr:transmembrane amino acid transporter protein-domain-containing protein [Exophiala viscosa]KAI1628744.1 transmembrane amino acid transporter protein-domain-containing protein [Exophiala viscosa]
MPRTAVDSSEVFEALAAGESDHDIKYRTMSWQRCAVLLFGDQVCLAIMAQAWTLKVLGWVPGLLVQFFSGILFWITSYTMWQYIMKHPQIRDICDMGHLLFGGNPLAYYGTMIGLVLYNVMLCGFHVLTGAQVLNTVTEHSLCSVQFGIIVTVIAIVLSAPRTLSHLSLISIASAICMALAILLFMVFVGKEANPAEYPTLGPVKTYAWPQEGTTWIECLNAVLNVAFLWFAQILFPTFIAEMRQPRDFPKALAAFSIASFVLFLVPAIVGFYYLGQYTEAPAFGSLQEHYKKVAYGPVIVPTIIIGVIYANVSVKFIYRVIMRDSRHQHSHTFIGWGMWIILMTIFWFVAFVFAEVIPSMGDFGTILGASFDSQFGLVFWAVAYWHLFRGRLWDGLVRTILTVLHLVGFVGGLFLFGPGLYASVKAIIADYANPTRPAFSCTNLSI